MSILGACVNMSAVPMEVRIGHQMPWGWSYKECEPHDVGAGNQIQVLCKRNQFITCNLNKGFFN